jgi:hypothetical protein
MNSSSRDIIKQILRETIFHTPSDKTKNVMFKLWDKQKSKGIKPMVNMALAKSVGLHNLGTLEDWAVEWYGGVDKVFQRVKEELDDKSFTTDYLEQKYGIRVGNYDFKFELTNLKLYDRSSGVRSVLVDMEILDGGVELITDGEYYDLTRINDSGYMNGDLRWELIHEINDIIREFIHGVTNQYHLWVDSVSIELI